ncbi:hypothetical protein F4802DRAFT_616806 [Xylaria palmicola]|nr:hypothetical protein F4802DRAFT_616806 [Xylaria palmicola]
MAFLTAPETFHRVTAQPGSTAKKWDREELVRCRATGTGIEIEPNLKGPAHPVFANWLETESELQVELEQPVLLASKILKAVGITWLSDFLIDDVFAENYPGREQRSSPEPIFACRECTTPRSILRHRRASWATREKQTKWRRSARETLRKEFPKLIQWQVDKDMFRQKGWNGYTCRHPKGDVPLSEVDKYETIQDFDRVSPHEGARNLTILVMAEYPARLAELRRAGKAQSEEYLLTAFMATVTILHELGHAIYWKDRRSLTRTMREPFYGADLEMELGDSFVAALFGGWIPVPVRELSGLRKDFSFADGVAWRQALSWDYHRMRPKYRAHYSIPVDYVARLFTEASWSTTTPDGVAQLVRPRTLTGNSIALRTVGLHAALTETNQHATAAIADFHCKGAGWAWNRRPGAWFRIPQYDGWVYPDLELPTACEDAVCEPQAREPPAGPGKAIEESPRRFSLVSPASATKIRRPVSGGYPVPLSDGAGMGKPRRRDRANSLPLARVGAAAESQLRQEREPPAPLSSALPPPPPPPPPPRRVQGRRSHQGATKQVRREEGKKIRGHERGEISVDELKKRLSRLIGVSMTELERLFDRPQCM